MTQQTKLKKRIREVQSRLSEEVGESVSYAWVRSLFLEHWDDAKGLSAALNFSATEWMLDFARNSYRR